MPNPTDPYRACAECALLCEWQDLTEYRGANGTGHEGRWLVCRRCAYDLRATQLDRLHDHQRRAATKEPPPTTPHERTDP